MNYFFWGCAFWGGVIFALWTLRPGGRLASVSVQTMGQREKRILLAIMTLTVLMCVLPMALNPIWNGEIPDHRNQYELLAESILKGHIYIPYDDIDPRLLEMDNPYDAALRSQLGVSYHWDHAFYNGHYYMYFGVVPVFLLFLPVRLLTGAALTTYHATQIFTALFIVGVFLLFLLLARRFFNSLTWAVYLPLAVSVSVMSVWYAVGAPALYCTAITAALCTEIWSLFWFAKAVWYSKTERQAVLYGLLGSLLGALAFGCRPTIALANLLAVPLFIHYLKEKHRRSLAQIAIVVSPYVVVGVLLMAYNYARFDDPFEFGQCYQLTVTDQSQYGSIFSNFDVVKVLNGILSYFFDISPMGEEFPYVTHSSVLMNFPMCILGLVLLVRTEVQKFLKEQKLRLFLFTSLGVALMICVAEVQMSPFLLERYRMDVYWLMGLAVYISFGAFYHTASNRKACGYLLSLVGCVTVLKAIMLWMVPSDSNLTSVFPEYLDAFRKALTLGL